MDIDSRPAKRQRTSAPTKDIKSEPREHMQMPAAGIGHADEQGALALVAAGKPKRVRTGCLTCRERHLKCDEALPYCLNCQKSSRICKRGIRLNFIDTNVKNPYVLPPTADWSVIFQDESREIASEYKGGLSRYAHIAQTITPPREPPAADLTIRQTGYSDTMTTRNNDVLPPIQTNGPYTSANLGIKQEYGHTRQGSRHHSHTGSDASFLTALGGSSSYGSSDHILTPTTDVETRRILTSPDEVLFMQVFCEEVGIWMDSMDPQKHFSRLLPFQALMEPMLLNAFLACGARHLTLVNSAYLEDKALFYYDTATTQLRRSLGDPGRDTVCCATTAVILNVYEIMSERATDRMNHIRGARALVKECGWNATSTGIGGACFWLNVGMELLSCLHFNWMPAWEPDEWGLDMNFQRDNEPGKEEVWVHRVLYIVGKIAGFKASIPNFQEPSAHDEQMRHQRRCTEWQHLKNLCDSWDRSIPRTMQPIGFLHPGQNSSKSAFPEVWLIKRATIVGRLFYHTAMCLIAQTNPQMSKDSPEMSGLQMEHARLVCGIVAHTKDRGVASVAIRSLAIAAECLVERQEQEEVLDILNKIQRETGWKVGFLHRPLKIKWGWISDDAPKPMIAPQSSLGHFLPMLPQTTSLPPAPSQAGKMFGRLNPLLATADFSLPDHPYQEYYTPLKEKRHFIQHNYM